MPNESCSTILRTRDGDSGEPISDRQELALDALSHLVKQFSTDANFDHLMTVFLLTLSGQFSVTSVMAVLRRPRGRDNRRFGTGRFADPSQYADVTLPDNLEACFAREGCPMLREQLVQWPTATSLNSALERCGIQVVCPLVHNKRLLGIVGLHEKVDGKPYGEMDVALLDTLINTVSPFIANSYLFTEIRDLNTWYLEILDNVRLGVLVFDEEDRLRQINRAGLHILSSFDNGVDSTKSPLGLLLSSLFPGSVFPGWLGQFARARSHEEAPVIKNLVAKDDRSERVFAVRVSPIARDDQKPSEIIVTLNDITSQKQSERRLFDLEKAVARGEIASSVSHELNNFLGMILGGVEISQLSLGKGNTEKALSTLERLKDHVEKMERFTSALTDSTRLRTQKASANLNRIIAEVLSFVSAQERFKGVAIITNLDPRLPEFEVDCDQLAQLVLNLVNNAADAIRETDTDVGQVAVTTEVRGEQVILRITDNGCGIDPKIREKLFKRRVTTKEKGHGYGLRVCSQILRNHGASVDVESELAKGTTFAVRFPTSPPPATIE